METVFPYLFCLWLGSSNILFYLELLIKDLHKCYKYRHKLYYFLLFITSFWKRILSHENFALHSKNKNKDFSVLSPYGIKLKNMQTKLV